MTKAGKRYAFELAVCLAVMMHLMLFMAVRPSNGHGLSEVLPAPYTHYLAKPPVSLPAAGESIRTVCSPVLFSLPSEMGFSRDLLEDNLNTRLTFARKSDSENFLEIDRVSQDTAAQVVPQELMLTAGENIAPQLPFTASRPLGRDSAARRILVAPELNERLTGWIVLPSELNQEGGAAWEVSADVSISKQGVVQYILLEQPLEMAELNQAALHFLRRLRFKPGDGPVAGRIEIYSPETALGEGGFP